MRFTLALFAIVAAANATNLLKAKAAKAPASSKLQNVKAPSLTPAASKSKPAIVALVGPNVSAKTKLQLKAFYQAHGINGKVSAADKKTISAYASKEEDKRAYWLKKHLAAKEAAVNTAKAVAS